MWGWGLVNDCLFCMKMFRMWRLILLGRSAFHGAAIFPLPPSRYSLDGFSLFFQWFPMSRKVSIDHLGSRALFWYAWDGQQWHGLCLLILAFDGHTLTLQ